MASPSRPPPSPRPQGFTLVELLIAITLLALLSVLLFDGLNFGTRVAGEAAARQDRTAALATAMGFLRGQLADAQPLEMGQSGGGKGVAFEGEPDSVEFAALPPAYLAEGGWHTLRVGFERQRKGGRLVVAWRLLESDNGKEAVSRPRRSTLLDGVKAIEFGYFGQISAQDAPQWHDHWRDSDHLPALVRLHITFLDGSTVPDLIVALRAADPPHDQS